MSNVGYATVSIIPSAKGFQSALNKEIGPSMGAAGAAGGKAAGGKFKGAFMAPLAGLGGPMAAALGGAAIVGGLKGAIDAASDLNEVGTALKTVFGDGLADVEKFGAGGAKALGMSKLEALRAAQSFGVYGKAAGLSGKENAKFSTTLASLGTDLSSFYNTSPEEAIEAIGAGLRGEAEPLRRYGVLLDDATLRQQALKMGLVKTTKDALSPQNKVLAAQAVIMKQSKVAQGDFAKTSGGLANQQRILAAQMEDGKAKMGAVFLPLATSAVTAVNKYLFPAMGKMGDIASTAIGKLSPLKDVVVGLFDLFVKGDFTSGLGKALGVDEDSAIVDNLFTIRDTFISAFGAIRNFIVAEVMPRFMGIVGAIRGFVTVAGPIVAGFVTGMMTRLRPLLPQIKAIFGTIGGIITGAMELVRAIIERVTAVISYIWANWGQGIMNVLAATWGALVGVIGPVLNVIKSVIATVTAAIKGDWSGAWNGIKSILSGVMSVIRGVVSGTLGILASMFGGVLKRIAGLWSSGWNGIASFFSGLWNRITSAVSTGIAKIITFFAQLPGKILGAITALPGKLFSFGVNTIQGFINGLVSKAGEIAAVVRDKVIGVLPDFVKDFLGIHSPSRVFAEIGKWTGQGFIVGITGTKKALLAKTGRMIEALLSANKKGLAKYARGIESQLAAHAARRDAIIARSKAAEAQLKKLQASASEAGKKAKEAVLESGSVVGKSTFKGIVFGLTDAVAKAKAFASAISALRKSGLNATSLGQIIEAGPGDGLAAAKALLASGKAGMAKVNGLVGQLAKSANSVGATATSALYSAGVNAAKGLVAGLKSQEKAITAQMSKIASSMIATIKKALKIHSPSRVFMKLGAFTGEGMARGIDSSRSRVTKAADALAYVPEARLNASAPAAGAGPLVGSLTFQSSGDTRRDIDEALFQLRTIARGGAYARP